MIRDFTHDGSNALVQGSGLFDLHNLYDCVGILLRPTAAVWLYFEASASYPTAVPPLAIEFDGVDFLQISPALDLSALRNLDEMGYKAPDDVDDEWLLTEDQSRPLDHLFFRFENGAFIRLHSRSARLLRGAVVPLLPAPSGS